MKKLVCISMLTLAFLFPSIHAAQAEYPTKPITAVVAWGPGGTGDLVMRILTSVVADEFPQPVVVMNRPGAGGIVGSTLVANSKPDGYTLLNARVSNGAIIPVLNKTIPYKLDDFDFVGLLDVNPLVIVVRQDSPYKTLKDLGEGIKANPGKITMCNSGPLNLPELVSLAFLRALNLEKDAVVNVPFGGDMDAKNAILGGHIVSGAITFPAAYDQLGEGGGLRALAVTTEERLEGYPDIPTVREAGFPDLENMVSWNAIYAPKGTPKEIIQKWESALATLKGNKAWEDPIEKMGSIPYILSASETKEFMAQQRQKFKELGDSFDLYVE